MEQIKRIAREENIPKLFAYRSPALRENASWSWRSPSYPIRASLEDQTAEGKEEQFFIGQGAEAAYRHAPTFFVALPET